MAGKRFAYEKYTLNGAGCDTHSILYTYIFAVNTYLGVVKSESISDFDIPNFPQQPLLMNYCAKILLCQSLQASTIQKQTGENSQKYSSYHN